MRKNKKLSITLMAGMIALALLTGSQSALAEETSSMVRIRITGTDGEAQIILNDSQPARELAAMLPLSLTFRDYVGEEKIADLKRILLKYVSGVKDQALMTNILLELYMSEEELEAHTFIEDSLVIPRVKNIEKGLL